MEQEIKLLPMLLNGKHGCAIDIGANHGIYTEYLISKCKMQVHAFEPQPLLCEQLTRVFRHFDGYTIYNMGLSSQESELVLHIPFKNGLRRDGYATFQDIKEPHESIRVPVKTLDSFRFENVDFIKIDVEGFEFAVLQGARETIIKNKPIMLIEVEQRHLNRASHSEVKTVIDIINHVIEVGYQCYCYVDKKFVCVDELNLNELQNVKNEHPKNTKYVNNFFFSQSQCKFLICELWQNMLISLHRATIK